LQFSTGNLSIDVIAGSAIGSELPMGANGPWSNGHIDAQIEN
jgi:hypothetical protein